MDRLKRSMVAVGLSAGLVAGGTAGMIFGSTGVSGAQDDTTTTAPVEDPGTDRSAEREQRHRERLSSTLAPLVEAGTIDQAQADAVIDALVAAQPDRGPGAGHGHRGGPGGPGLSAAAEALGLSEDELREQLRAGSTLAHIAEQQGVERQALVDALVAELEARLAEKVADGDLTQEQANEKLARATERIEERIDSSGPMRDGRRGSGPPPEDHPADDDAEQDPAD